jgi:hypothetical protein
VLQRPKYVDSAPFCRVSRAELRNLAAVKNVGSVIFVTTYEAPVAQFLSKFASDYQALAVRVSEVAETSAIQGAGERVNFLSPRR